VRAPLCLPGLHCNGPIDLPPAFRHRLRQIMKFTLCPSFDAPNTVQPQALEGVAVEDGKLSTTLPPKSVVVLEVL